MNSPRGPQAVMTRARGMALAGLFEALHKSRLMPVVRKAFGGEGIILLFHEIHDDPASELMRGTNAVFFDYLLDWLRKNNWEIVSLGEALRRLSCQDDTRRFAVLTFDDGYRDNITRALPVLERHSAPFTMFVPTGAPTRTLYSWWLGLRELFRKNDIVNVDAMNRRFHCPNLAAKVTGFNDVAQWVHQDLHRTLMLEPTFTTAGISLPALNDYYFLNESELKVLSHHRLATIGAHTDSHAALSILDAAAVRNEMVNNRVYLEGLVGRPIEHFAYPYGSRLACGPREAAIADELGFSSSVTTRHCQVTASDRNRLQFLPRIGVAATETPAKFDVRVSGLQRAFCDLSARLGVPWFKG